MTDAAGKSFIDLTANIVSAYLSNNPTPASEIPALISQIHAAAILSIKSYLAKHDTLPA